MLEVVGAAELSPACCVGEDTGVEVLSELGLDNTGDMCPDCIQDLDTAQEIWLANICERGRAGEKEKKKNILCILGLALQRHTVAVELGQPFRLLAQLLLDAGQLRLQPLDLGASLLGLAGDDSQFGF